MNVTFKSETVKKQFASQAAVMKTFKSLGPKVIQRLSEIEYCDNLRILKQLPALNCQHLTSDLNGPWSIKVLGRISIVFYLNHIPLPKLVDGTLDLNAVTDIIVSGIVK